MPLMAGDAVTYLDANATEPLRPEAHAAALEAMALAGNPAAVHQAGRAARNLLESSRKSLAGQLGGEPANLVFTSGGTEANALAIASFAAGRQVLFGATEHDAVRAAAQGSVAPCATLRVLGSGQADLAALEEALATPQPTLVCLMLANNETGVIHPIAEAASLCRARGAVLHVDAVQAAGRLAVNLPTLGAHSIAISGHKFGALKGAGALLLAPDAPKLHAVLSGGGQEQGRRGGTPALPAIASMAAALRACRGSAALALLRDRLEAEAVRAGAVVCGAEPRLLNTSCLALPGQRADLQVIRLDLAGFAVSAGAACSSGKVTRSRVLDAMGLSHLADCAIRVSLPWNVRETDIDGFVAAYAALSAGRRAA